MKKLKIFESEDSKTTKEKWDYIESNLPDYSSNNDVAYLNDLQAIMDGDASDEKIEKLGWKNSSKEDLQKEIDKYVDRLYDKAIKK